MSASIIRIKRSGVTGSPATLAQGELAYSYLPYNPITGQGGDRLYIGTGTETNGIAANIEVIGGKYFTEKLDHAPGVLTANSAIIVDDNKSIDELIIGNNITITGNTISTDSGDLVLNPAGDLVIISNVSITGDIIFTGNTALDNLFISSLTQNRVIYVGANGQLIDSANLTFDGSNLTVSGELNVDNLKLDGNTISSTNTNGNIVLDPNGTGKVDVSSSIITGVLDPVANTDVVNLQYLDAAEFTVSADVGTNAPVLVTSGTFDIEGGTGLTSSIAGSNGSVTVTIDLDDTGVVANTYGSTSKIPVFTVDAQGRLTSATEEDIATTLNIEADSGIAGVNLLTDVLNIIGGTGVSTLAANNTVTISIGQDVDPSSSVTFNEGTFNGNVSIAGDLLVSGNVTYIDTQTLEVEDPLIKLASGNVTDIVDIGFYGQYGPSSLKSGMFRSHTDGEYYLFSDLNADITTTNTINLVGLQLANMNIANMNLASLSASANVDVVGTVTAAEFIGAIDGGTY